MFVFVGVCAISLIMPFVIDGKLQVMSKATIGVPLEPLRFKSSNVTNTVAVLYGVCFATFIAQWNLDPKCFFKTLRVYIASGVFICIWGMMQFVLYLFHVPYPVSIFNNAASPYAVNDTAYLDTINIPRVSSVALEPSILATVLVAMLPILVIAIFGGKRIFGKYADRAALFLLCVTLLVTTSATGFVSVAGLLVFLGYTLYKYKRLSFIPIATLLIVALLLVFAYVAVPGMNGAAQEVLFNKANSWSALVRSTVIMTNLQYFTQYPLLGLGWGSAPAHDLTMGILANCGLLGLASFLLFIGYTMNKLRNNVIESFNSCQPFNHSHILLISLLITCLAYMITGLPGGPSFWLLVGLAVSAGGQTRVSSKNRAGIESDT
jgi:O-antigen ligase